MFKKWVGAVLSSSVGVVVIHVLLQNCAYLCNMAVAPEWRRRGIASLLLEAAEEVSRATGEGVGKGLAGRGSRGEEGARDEYGGGGSGRNGRGGLGGGVLERGGGG